jgi:3-oxoacyl-[acyl-carrier protein] reductase
MPTLTGKNAIVTGGSRGIGRAIVERLVAEGAQVVFSYERDAASADALVQSIQGQGGKVWAVRADMGDSADVHRMFDEAQAHLGALDILVNNAGTTNTTAISDVTPELFDRVFAVNAKGPFLAIQRAGSAMRDDGRIVNISSMTTVTPWPNMALYAATKAALEQFTMTASRELGPRRITVNAILPGAIDTDLLRQENTDEALDFVAASSALGRLGRTSDIAGTVAFLAGPDSAFVTGQLLRVEGGFLV